MSSYLEEDTSSNGMLFTQNNHPDVLSLFRSSTNQAAEMYLTSHLHDQTIASLPAGATPGEGMKRLKSLREKVKLLKEKKKQNSQATNHTIIQDSNQGNDTENDDFSKKDIAFSEDTIDEERDEAIIINSSSFSDDENNDNDRNVFNTVLNFQNEEKETHFDTKSEFISIGGTKEDIDDSEKAQFAIDGFRKDSPWMRRSKKYSKHPALALHQEIIDFVRMIEETESERVCRLGIIEKIQSTILQIEPTAEFQVYGSFPVNLMIPGSDVDMLMKSKRINSQSKNKSFMFRLKSLLEASGFVSTCNVITNAKVPIIKIQEKSTQHWFDLHVDYDNSKNVDDVVNFVKKKLEEYPSLRYLVLVIKYFLKQRGVNDAANGGMSSFGVFLMCLSLLQNHDSSFDEEICKKTSLGTLLLDFFALYGIYFNYSKVAISCTKDGAYYPKNEVEKYIIRPSKFSIHGQYANRLVILDPLDKTNCVTFITSNIEMIRFSFANAFRLLTSEWKIQESLLNRVIISDNILFSRAIALKSMFKGNEIKSVYSGKRKRHDEDDIFAEDRVKKRFKRSSS